MQNDAKIQAIFDKVIASNIYPDTKYFMCLALHYAADNKVISRRDAALAEEAIDTYLASNGKEEPSYTLLDFLGHSIMRDVPLGITTFCLPVYKDWKNRPIKSSPNAK